MRRLLTLFCLLLLAGAARGQRVDPTWGGAFDPALPGRTGDYFFYRGRDFGSQRLIHPLRLIVNGGYGLLTLDNRDDRPHKVAYATGALNVAENIAVPTWAIGEMGLGEFLTTQVIPISINTGRAQYWPNYMNHLLGGGMSFRMMQEWYRYHGWSDPTVAAFGTIFAYHFLNEVVENNDDRGPSADVVADFWIFNPAGIVLFGNDAVARFFAETLHMTDWSYQPVIVPETGALLNQGQNYAVKYHLDERGGTSLFYHWGGHAELGLSFTRADGRCLSAGVGLVAKKIKDVDRFSKTLDLAASAGLFYDRENSLLASLIYARTKSFKWRLNLYPGLVRIGPLRPGFLLATDREDRVTVGLTLGRLTHLPVGVGGIF